jgi:hypothetical protein
MQIVVFVRERGGLQVGGRHQGQRQRSRQGDDKVQNIERKILFELTTLLF